MSYAGWELFEKSIGTVERIYLWGPKGIGKTFSGHRAMRNRIGNNQYFRQVTLNEDMVMQELIGTYVPRGNEFLWNDGPVTKPFRHGGGLVINELARASGAVKDMFLGILDDKDVACLSLPNGDQISRADDFLVVATANSHPDELDEALHDRFDAVIHVQYPHPDIISELDRHIGGFGSMIFTSYKDDESRAISPRRGFAFLKFLAKGVSLRDAAELAFENRYEDILALMKMNRVAVRNV